MPDPNGNEGGERLFVRRLNRILTMLFFKMKDLTDEGRDLPVRWHMMHMYSSAQIGKLLALHRGLDAELAGMAGALHDIGSVMTKKHEGHAQAAERYVRDLLGEYNSKFGSKLTPVSQEETDQLLKAIARHSEKKIDSNDPLSELLKDADSLDGYLHGVRAEGARFERCKRALKELGIVFDSYPFPKGRGGD